MTSAPAGRISEQQLAELRHRNPVHDVAKQWVRLRKHGRGFIGPCPVCSADPQSKQAGRFEIKTADSWVCAVCADGGDVIRLIMKREGLDFTAAIERLGGIRPADPEADARRAAERAAAEKKRAEDAAFFRERERGTLYDIWKRALPAEGSAVERYLRGRGLEHAGGMRLRCVPDMPYYAHGGAQAAVVWRGAAMVAPIVGADGRFSGLHFTYLDPAGPKGKAAVRDPDSGELLPAKKVRGSKAGGHIAVIDVPDLERLVVGEGNEKVLAVAAALAGAGGGGWDLARTAFWTSVDLGNLGGRATATVAHPTLKTPKGRPQRVPGPDPDLDAPAIVIPDSVRDVVILGDSTSDAFLTRCAIARAVRRFARDGRSVRVAWAPAEKDFDEIPPAETVAIVAAAAPFDPATLAVGALDVAALESATLPDDGPSAQTDNAGGHDGPPEPPPPDDIPPGPREFGARRGRRAKGHHKRDGGLNLRLAFYPQTDLGNAERFVERSRGKLLWCPAMGWLWWDGRRWSADGAEGRATIAEHDCVRAIQDEAEALAASEFNRVGQVVNEGKKNERVLMMSDILSAWGRASEEARRLSPIKKRAAPYLEVAVSDLDAAPFRINVLNGTLVIDRSLPDYVRLDPHDPDDLITKLAPVTYNPKAVSPLYDRFLAEVQPNPDNVRFLHRWGGYSGTADTSEQLLTFNWGKGKNGKSTLFNAWAHVFGDYGRSVGIETFLNSGLPRSGSQPSPDIAMLKGVRFLRTSEPERGAKLAEALIKLATGGEEMPARHLNKEFFMLMPTFKLTMSGNYRPKIEGTDEGIWRRVRLVPWVVTIPPEKRDKLFGEKLKAEASGILNRLLDGLRDWMDHGLAEPKDVVDATQEYRDDSDPLGRFLEACVVAAPGERVQSSVLHEVFCAWARVNGATEWTGKGFTLAMDDKGYRRIRSDVTLWLDIRLIKTRHDFVDGDGKPWRVDDPNARPAPVAAADMIDPEFI